MSSSKSTVVSVQALGNYLTDSVLDRVSDRMSRKTRRRKLGGLRGFLWLGLFVAAHAGQPNLEVILGHAATVLGNALTQCVASVSAFCQYRLLFPPQGSVMPLARPHRAGP
jgi:hypothetical protein